MQKLAPEQVSLQDILDAKERRAERQAELRTIYNAAIISITVNMPGSVKYSADILSLIYSALEKLRANIAHAGLRLLEERICHAAAGPAALLAVHGDADLLKTFGIAVEEEAPYGRLLDIDVFDHTGRQINRVGQGLPARTCFVCSGTAVDCMRAKAHSPQEVLDGVQKLLFQHQSSRTCLLPKEIEIIGSTALEAMLLEAACSPAPGLVDRFNSGAHQDMDIFTFIQSSSALAPAMYQCSLAGWNHSGPVKNLLPVLRCIGAEAEKSMFKATQGVNTQKGLLFLMGVIAAAAALATRETGSTNIAAAIVEKAASICSGIVERELAHLNKQLPPRPLTAGEKLYLSYGITGIRGEIEDGLPSVMTNGLPTLTAALESGLSLNDALIQTLISLMLDTQDTTILNRHNPTVLKQVQQDAAYILERGGMYTALGRGSIEKLDQIYIKKNISPGGSADLLAVTYFLHAIGERMQLKQ